MGLIGLGIAVLSLVVAVATPELRRMVGLDHDEKPQQPAPTPAPIAPPVTLKAADNSSANLDVRAPKGQKHRRHQKP